MRARSFLFLALGVAVGCCTSRKRLIVAENGFITLNVPLTRSRMGSLTTRTTHPFFMMLFRSLISDLGITTKIDTPYTFRTKGEMLSEVTDRETLRNAVHHTMSCARPSAGRYQRLPVGQHCGYCMPCIIRRAALRTNRLDKEPRNKDVCEVHAPDEASGRDKRSFEIAIERAKGMSDVRLAAEIAASGPLPPEDIASYVGLYRRGLAEVERLFTS